MSKVIFKLSFKHPNKADTKVKNSSHVHYISCRPGTDKTITKSDLLKEVRIDEAQIVADESKLHSNGFECNMSDNTSYTDYIDKRPRSHGLFGQEGIEDPKVIQKELEDYPSYVWRGIISLKEEDAMKLGFNQKEQWQNMLRGNMLDIGEKMNIPSTNLRWVGAVHMEKGHPHAHVMIWEKKPQLPHGIIGNKKIEDIRKQLTENIFEDERINILNEKNSMRDLTNDLAKGDVSKSASLAREVKDVRTELNYLIPQLYPSSIEPRLYEKEEIEIAGMLRTVSSRLPERGRVMLKLMPDYVKSEISIVVDRLLANPEMAASLTRNLNAVEKLTRLYTGKNDAVQKARDNALEDIKDRLGQIVLKGAVECNKSNTFYVDQVLSSKAVELITTMDNSINLLPEQSKVLKEITNNLMSANLYREEIETHLTGYISKENLQVTPDSISKIVEEVIEERSDSSVLDQKLYGNKIDRMLSAFKVADYKEDQAFDKVSQIINDDHIAIKDKLDDLTSKGLLTANESGYALSDDGINEFLTVKELDKAEEEIFKMIDADDDNAITVNDLLQNKAILNRLYDRDPDEFSISKFDQKIRLEFGSENSIKLSDLETKLYEKYTDKDLNINHEKAEQEYDILKNSINKLAINGYVEFNKVTGSYSFTDEANSYFKLNDKGEYSLTDEAKDLFSINSKMDFSNYDATITLKYLDNVENGIITADNLKSIIHREISNSDADKQFSELSELIKSKPDFIKEYVSLDEEQLISTGSGKDLGFSLGVINKYSYKTKGKLTDKEIKAVCSDTKEYESISKQIEKGIKNGYLQKDNSGTYSIVPEYDTLNKLLYQIYKEGGALNISELNDVLHRNIPNREALKTYNHLMWRMKNLKEQGFLKGENNSFELTDKGKEKRANILEPKRNLLQKEMKYLVKLGLLEVNEDGIYNTTETYKSYIDSKRERSGEDKKSKTSDLLDKDIVKLIDNTKNSIDPDKMKRMYENLSKGKWIHDGYKDIPTSYEKLRDTYRVTDTISKTIHNLSTALLVSCIDIDTVKIVMKDWNVKANNIDSEQLEKLIDKANSAFADNKLWGKTTVISPSEWNDTFKNLGMDEDQIPKWIYKGENWESLKYNQSLNMANRLWKGIWNELEKQDKQTKAQAEWMKKNTMKHTDLSKSAKVERSKKHRFSNLYQDDELER